MLVENTEGKKLNFTKSLIFAEFILCDLHLYVNSLCSGRYHLLLLKLYADEKDNIEF